MSTTFTLVILLNESVRRVALRSSLMTVGRDPKVDILIPDPAISRRQFTIRQEGDHVLIEMSPQSRYQAVKNGKPAMQLEIYPGERFELGPYKFELQGQVELPAGERGPVDEDPGGPVILSLAQEEKRIAPRWRTHAEPDDAAPAPPPEIVPLWRRLTLPAAVVAVVGFLGYDTLKPAPPPPPAEQRDEAPPDLLAAVQPIDCQGPEACLSRARDAYQIGLKLGKSGTRDLLSLYKSAKQLHLARLALGKDFKKIPDLAEQADRAKQALDTEFSDRWFLYRRAVAQGQLTTQLESLGTILGVCGEERHRFCQNLELVYKRLEDQSSAN